MREIKFIGKSIADGRWVEGCLISDHQLQKYWIQGKYFSAIEVLPESVGQFTGLKECFGKGGDIFEGYVVKWHDWEGEEQITCIDWDMNMSRFVFRYKSGHYRNLSSEYKLQVVGHISTNAELLTD